MRRILILITLAVGCTMSTTPAPMCPDTGETVPVEEACATIDNATLRPRASLCGSPEPLPCPWVEPPIEDVVIDCAIDVEVATTCDELIEILDTCSCG